MLILSRKIGEQIVIGEKIVVTVYGVDRGQTAVKIGIDAPRDVKVLRAEIKEIKERNER